MGGIARTAAGGWWPLVLFFAANVLFAAGLFAHAFLYNFYLDELRLAESVLGLAAASLTAGGLAALFPAGLLVDRLGCGVAYLSAVALAAGGLIAGAIVNAPAQIYVAAFVAGAGAAMWRVASGPILMRLAAPSLRPRAFSWNVALLVGSGALWTAVSGAVPAGLRMLFGLDELNAIRGGLVLGACGTALAAPLFVLASRSRTAAAVPTSSGEAASLRTVVRGLRLPGRLMAVIALVTLWMTAGGLVIPFFNIYFQRVHDLAIGRIGVIFALAQGLTALVIFGSGLAATHLGPRRLLAAWTILFAPALWGLAPVSALGLAVVLYLVQGFVPPATNPLIDQILLEAAPPRRHGAISSWRNGATELSGLVGAGAAGWLLETGSFGHLFGVAGGVAALGAAGLLISLRRLDSESRVAKPVNR